MELVTISEENVDLLGISKEQGDMILKQKDGKDYELWMEQDDYAGYVIEVDGTAYQFVRSLSDSEIAIIESGE